MTKILGLDLGTNSIGWAVIDKNEKCIIDAGVRIFAEGVVKETIGQGDKEVSKNAERRQHRQARRLNYRKRLRKIKLLQALLDLKLCPLSQAELNTWKNWDKHKKSSGRVFPNSSTFVEWLRMNPYMLRSKAVSSPINRFEFGRILYHFIQRRGFLSSRKGNEDGAIYKGKDNMEGIDATKMLLDNSTLGKRLMQLLPPFREPYKRVIIDGKDARIRARYTLREMYVREFEEIWKRQASQLNLDKETVVVTKQVHFGSSADSLKAKRKIEYYRSKYGTENVLVNHSMIKINKEVPLKEFLAGKIDYTEDNIVFKSNESVLFWQRPLRSQKNLLGKCTFESRRFFDKTASKWIVVGSTPCPLSHPDFELFRAYQFINNIRFGKNNTRLNQEQREKILNLINKSDSNFDFDKIPKELKLTYEVFNYEDTLKVPGNPTHKKLKSFFSEQQWTAHYQDIWHCFYFYDDAKMLENKLVSTYGLSQEKAEKASKVKLKDGYGSISLKAIRNILPFLEMGYRYSTAVVLGGVRNAFGSRWGRFEMYHQEIISGIVLLVEKEDNKEFELIEKIKALLANPELNYGFVEGDKAFQKLYHHSQEIERKDIKNRLSEVKKLRNPIVQKGINEMRRLVNDLLDYYSSIPEFGSDFAFDRIHVELGRDLRNNKKLRQEMAFKIRENEKANDEARMRLAEFGLKPNRDNITRYLLFREIQNKNGHVVCPYTKKSIGISDLLGRENRFQTEHIVPYSVSLDDSFANKTICESNFNREKGELTPYEFYQRNSDPKLWNADSWDEIEQRAYSLLPYQKAKRFTAKKKTDAGEFIDRQLNDLRYISKKSAEILSEICSDVRVMPGRLTSELRRLWGLNNISDPVFPLHLDGYKVDDQQAIPHYLVLDAYGNPKEIKPFFSERPQTSSNEILIPGSITERGLFVADKNFRHLKFDIDAPGLKPGRYWAKLKVEKPTAFTRIFTEKPMLDQNYVVYRGKIEKGRFLNDSLGKKIETSCADGIYWAKMHVKKAHLMEPEKDKQPPVGKDQILLFGYVRENVFSSFAYQCETELDPGRYWALLDVDFGSPTFTRAINNPDDFENGIIVVGSVNEEAVFEAECDPEYTVQTTLTPAKYFAKISVIACEGFSLISNQPPAIERNDRLLEGNVWVNKQTGEIMFDPKKNRDDQRHHAIDAIAIALTELGYLQKLSHYFGQIKGRERGIGERPVFDLPWLGFDKDVKKAIDKILVSYSKRTKVVNKISKTIIKSGKKYRSVGFAARGRLHREYYFGKHPNPIPGSSDIENRGPLFEKDKQGNTIHYFHIRKPITSIENDKHVRKIVDSGIRRLIETRLCDDFGIDTTRPYTIPDNFFFDKDKNPTLFLKNKRGEPVPIKKVRLKEVIGNAAKLKSDINQWVNPYNNHHVVVYEDANGDLQEQVVSLWDVVERNNQGLTMYSLPADGKKIIATLQENDMFLLDLSPEQVAYLKLGVIPREDLSSHLYRVQKISSMYYTFRHHLASTVTNADEEIRIQSFSAWNTRNPVKVEVDVMGKLKCKG